MATQDVFGIEFDQNEKNKAKHIPVSPKKKRDNIRETVRQHWELKQPKLIISVTGSEENFHLSQKLGDTIERDLMDTSIRTGAWIVTSGSYSGVAKHVGKVVNRNFENSLFAEQHAMPVIGIRNREQNMEHTDHNHSHFIVVHDAKQRAKLEKELTHATETMKRNIPIVQLVLGGGFETLEAVYHTLQNEMPIVIVEGSKRIAFILAYAYKHAQEKTIQSKSQGTKSSIGRVMDDCDERTVRGMITKEFKSDNIEEHMKIIKKCLEKADLITVFELDSKTQLHSTMLQALLKDNNNDVTDNMRMALAWETIDVAKSIILTYENSKKLESLENVMLKAIIMEKADFVKLFLDHGFCLKKFLTKERLLQLYTRIPETCVFWSLIEKISKKNNKDREETDFDLDDVTKLIRHLIGEESEWSVTDVEQPYNALFIRSILMVEQDMAETFWVKGKDAMAKALVGYTLLTSLKSKLKGTNQEDVNKIQNCINEWSTKAVGMLNECHDMDEQNTQKLLVRKMSDWGNASCFLIAVNSNNKEFISQRACQNLLNNIWNGRLSHDNTFLRYLCCMFFPILVIPGLKFRQDTFSQSEQSQVSKNTSEEKNTRSERRNSASIPSRSHENSKNMETDGLNMETDGLNMETDGLNMETDGLKITSIEKLYFFFRAPAIICMYNTVGCFSSSRMCRKLNIYISDGWNKFDILTIVLFISGMTIRFLPYNEALEAARVVLAVSYLLFCLRLLHISSVHIQLGPKLIMIKKMLEDLMYFLVILMLFIVSYGIASHSILYPNSPLTISTVVQVIRTAYWNFHGELFLDVIEGYADCTNDEMLWSNGTSPRCPSDIGKVVVPIMLAGYVMVTSVLLLNLLIAMFSFTFGKVQAKSKTTWWSQRYSFIREYSDRSAVCPPFVLLIYLFLLGRCIFAKPCKTGNIRSGSFKREFQNNEKLDRWEKEVAEAYHQTLEKEASAKMDVTVNRSSELLGRIEAKQRKLQRKLQSAHLEMKQQIQRLAESLERRNIGEGYLRNTTVETRTGC